MYLRIYVANRYRCSANKVLSKIKKEAVAAAAVRKALMDI